jgi:uncharacterized protein (UPF0332 family)
MAHRKTDHLRGFATAKKRDLDRFDQAVMLQEVFRCSIGELRLRVVRDRIGLARHCLTTAKRALRHRPISYRLVVGRSYYAMYHAVRAVVFLSHGGDDHEAHDKLPGQLPNDFTDRANWENVLKTARLDRNRADYDPYPKKDVAFRDTAYETCRAAQDLIQECRSYLRSKGCQV